MSSVPGSPHPSHECATHLHSSSASRPQPPVPAQPWQSASSPSRGSTRLPAPSHQPHTPRSSRSGVASCHGRSGCAYSPAGHMTRFSSGSFSAIHQSAMASSRWLPVEVYSLPSLPQPLTFCQYSENADCHGLRPITAAISDAVTPARRSSCQRGLSGPVSAGGSSSIGSAIGRLLVLLGLAAVGGDGAGAVHDVVGDEVQRSARAPVVGGDA